MASPVGLAVAQTPNQAPDEPQQQPTREQRTQERKEKLQVNLTTDKTNRIKGRCKAAQAKLQAASKRIEGVRTGRSEAYNNLTSRLNVARDQLTQAQLDTEQLEEAIADLADAVVTYKTSMTDFQAAVDDAAQLDCEADPEAFWLALTDARELVSGITDNHQTIKKILKDNVKPELIELRKQLGSHKDETEEQ